MESIPLVDLADFHSGDEAARLTFGRGLRSALTEFGFVRVTGHEITADLITRVYRAFEQFFARSDDEKALCSGVAGGQRGFTPFGIEHAKDQVTADLKEFYHVGRELDRSHQLFDAYPRNVWPRDADDLRNACLALYAALDHCASSLLEGLAMGFDLPRFAFADMLRDGNSILRALHYPPVETAKQTAMRAAPHEDINLITLLPEATDAGLEILTRDGDWLDVPAHPGELIADAGDMLSRVTNDVIPSTTHRVVASPDTRGRHRYSLPYFAHPYPECDLSVLDAFVEKGSRPKYPPITAASFLNERLREIGLI